MKNHNFLCSLILALFFTSLSKAQEYDSQIFHEWSLVQIFDSEGNLEYTVSDIEPEIITDLSFYSTNFYGYGACNDFSGSIGFDANNQSIITDFDPNAVDCVYDAHDSFESAYFGFFTNVIVNNLGVFDYSIIPSSDGFGLELTLSSPNLSSLVFRNYEIPDSQLFQTWYLVQNYETEGNIEYIVADIEPEILPTLTLNNDSSFNGIAACNDYSGTIIYLPTSPYTPDNDIMEITNLTTGITDCSDNIHNDFENMYFSFLNDAFSSFDYEIIPSTDGLGLNLILHSPIFNGLVYRNYQLSISEKQLQNIKLTYNTEHTILFVKDPNNSIVNIEIYNIHGQNMKTINNDYKSIDISTLATGVYLVKIKTSLGEITKRIIKK